MIWVAAALLVVGGLLAAAWTLKRRELGALDAAARSRLGGRYVTLPQGIAHVEMDGPEDGPVFLLVTGGGGGGWAWRLVAPRLAAAGWRVVGFDTFGRGRSDRPDAAYDLDFHLRQVWDLLDALGAKAPVDMAGVSQGGLVAAAALEARPDRVRQATLIAPLVDGRRAAKGLGFLLWPGVGEYCVRVLFGDIYEKLARALAARARDGGDQDVERFIEQTRFVGYQRAMLRSTRNTILRDYSSIYQALGAAGARLQVIWGDQDSQIARWQINRLVSLAPQTALQLLPGVEHAPPLEAPERVAELLLAFHARPEGAP